MMDSRKRPLVAILMGSDSDLPTMSETEKMLERFGIPFTTRITSAHRTPDRTAELARGLEDDGVEVVVAGAGLAAHLAGVVASYTTLPVIGVPMESKELKGVDSLFSIVQMPSGIPVATVAIGKAGARNAGILAMQIMSLGDRRLEKALDLLKRKLAAGVRAKNKKLCS